MPHEKPLLDTYFAKNQAKVHVNYDNIMQQAKKVYSKAERIVRVFVIGNPGAGKSSWQRREKTSLIISESPTLLA